MTELQTDRGCLLLLKARADRRLQMEKGETWTPNQKKVWVSGFQVGLETGHPLLVLWPGDSSEPTRWYPSLQA